MNKKIRIFFSRLVIATQLVQLLLPAIALAADNMCNVNPGTCVTQQDWEKGWGDARKEENAGATPKQDEWTNVNNSAPEIIREDGESNDVNRSQQAADAGHAPPVNTPVSEHQVEPLPPPLPPPLLPSQAPSAPPPALPAEKPSDIYCNYCGGFYADPKGAGCRDQAIGKCPDESGLKPAVVGAQCFNANNTLCGKNGYGTVDIDDNGDGVADRTEVLTSAAAPPPGQACPDGKQPTAGRCFEELPQKPEAAVEAPAAALGSSVLEAEELEFLRQTRAADEAARYQGGREIAVETGGVMVEQEILPPTTVPMPTQRLKDAAAFPTAAPTAARRLEPCRPGIGRLADGSCADPESNIKIETRTVRVGGGKFGQEVTLTTKTFCSGDSAVTQTRRSDGVESSSSTACDWGCAGGACRGPTPEEAQVYRYSVLQNAIEREQIACRERSGDARDAAGCSNEAIYNRAVNNLQPEELSPVQVGIFNQAGQSDAARQAIGDKKYDELVNNALMMSAALAAQTGAAAPLTEEQKAGLRQQADAYAEEVVGTGSLSATGYNTLNADSQVWDKISNASAEGAARLVDQQGWLGGIIANNLFCAVNNNYWQAGECGFQNRTARDDTAIEDAQGFWSFLVAGKSEQTLWDQGMIFGDPRSAGYQAREYEDRVAPACGVQTWQRSLTDEEKACLTGQSVAGKARIAEVDEQNAQMAALNIGSVALGFAGGAAAAGIKGAGLAAQAARVTIGSGALSDAAIAVGMAEAMTAGDLAAANAVEAMSQAEGISETERQTWSNQAEELTAQADEAYKQNVLYGVLFAAVGNVAGEVGMPAVGKAARETLGETPVGRLLFGNSRAAAEAAEEVADAMNTVLVTPKGTRLTMKPEAAGIGEIGQGGGNIEFEIPGVPVRKVPANEIENVLVNAPQGTVARSGDGRIFMVDSAGKFHEFTAEGKLPTGVEAVADRAVTAEDVLRARNTLAETGAGKLADEPMVAVGGDVKLLPAAGEVAEAVDNWPVRPQKGGLFDQVVQAPAAVRNAADDAVDDVRVFTNCKIVMSPVSQVYAASGGGCFTVSPGQNDVPELGEGVSVKPDADGQAVEVHSPGAELVVIHQGETGVLPTGEEVHVVAVKSDGTAVMKPESDLSLEPENFLELGQQFSVETPVKNSELPEVKQLIFDPEDPEVNLRNPSTGTQVEVNGVSYRYSKDAWFLVGTEQKSFIDDLYTSFAELIRGFGSGRRMPLVSEGEIFPGLPSELIVLANRADKGAQQQMVDSALANFHSMLSMKQNFFPDSEVALTTLNFRDALRKNGLLQQDPAFYYRLVDALHEDLELASRYINNQYSGSLQEVSPSLRDIRVFRVTDREYDEYVRYAHFSPDNLPNGAVIVDLGSGATQKFSRQINVLRPDITAVDVDASLALPLNSKFYDELAPSSRRLVYEVQEPEGREVLQTTFETRQNRKANIAPGTIAAVLPDIPLPTNSVDEIIDMFGPGIYLPVNQKVDYFEEVYRVLKSDGRGRIYPIDTALETNETYLLKRVGVDDYKSRVINRVESHLIEAGIPEDNFQFFEQADQLGNIRLGLILTKSTELPFNLGNRIGDTVENIGVGMAKGANELTESVTEAVGGATAGIRSAAETMAKGASDLADSVSGKKSVVEHFTGVKYDDPSLPQRITDDHFAIKQKYGLPDRGQRFKGDLAEYIRELERIAKENGIPVRDKSEFAGFFEEYELAGAVYDDKGKQIFIDFSADPVKRAGDLEHELIHALQDKKYPGMPFEVREYEAYVGANTSIGSDFLSDPENVDSMFAQIGLSSKYAYESEGLLVPWERKETLTDKFRNTAETMKKGTNALTESATEAVGGATAGIRSAAETMAKGASDLADSVSGKKPVVEVINLEGPPISAAKITTEAFPEAGSVEVVPKGGGEPYRVDYDPNNPQALDSLKPGDTVDDVHGQGWIKNEDGSWSSLGEEVGGGEGIAQGRKPAPFEYNEQEITEGTERFDAYERDYGMIPENLQLPKHPEALHLEQEELIRGVVELSKGNDYNPQPMIDLLRKKNVSVHVYNEQQLYYANLLIDKFSGKSIDLLGRSLPTSLPNVRSLGDIPGLVQKATESGSLVRVPSQFSVGGFNVTDYSQGLLGGKKPVKGYVFILNSEEYGRTYRVINSIDQQILFLQKLGHEAGHALDGLEFGLGRAVSDTWVSELRQKEFNSIFYAAVDKTNPSVSAAKLSRDYGGFLSTAQKRSNLTAPVPTIGKASSFTELKVAVRKQDGVRSSSGQFYSAFELEEIIDKIANGRIDSSYATTGDGFRAKIDELLKQQGRYQSEIGTGGVLQGLKNALSGGVSSGGKVVSVPYPTKVSQLSGGNEAVAGQLTDRWSQITKDLEGELRAGATVQDAVTFVMNGLKGGSYPPRSLNEKQIDHFFLPDVEDAARSIDEQLRGGTRRSSGLGIVAPGFREGEPFGPGGWFDFELRPLRDPETGRLQFPVGRKTTDTKLNFVPNREKEVSAAGGGGMAGFAGAVDHRRQTNQNDGQKQNGHSQIDNRQFTHNDFLANRIAVNQQLTEMVPPNNIMPKEVLSNMAGITTEPTATRPKPTRMSTMVLNWRGESTGFWGTRTNNNSAIGGNGITEDSRLSMTIPKAYAAERAPANGAGGTRIMPLSMYRALAGQLLLKKAIAALPENERSAEKVGAAALAAATMVNSIPRVGTLLSNEAGYAAVSGTGGAAAGAVGKGIYRVTAEAVGGVDLVTPAKVNVGVNGSGAVLIGVTEGRGRVKTVGELEWWEKPMMRLGEWIEAKFIKPVGARAFEGSDPATLEGSDPFVAGIVPLTIQLFIDENKNGKMDEGEDPAKLAGVKVNLAAETKTVSYNLTEGWNLAAFPLIPESVKTAAELIQDVALDGGYVTTVATWEQDKWMEFSQRGAQKFGQDFELTPGRAYFLNSHAESTWTLAGTPLPAEKQALQLRKGWNGVGLPEKVGTAVQFMDEIQSVSEVSQTSQCEVCETADQAARWDFGLWDVVVKRRYSPENHEIYGRDFPIKETEGYFIHTNEEVRFR